MACHGSTYSPRVLLPAPHSGQVGSSVIDLDLMSPVTGNRAFVQVKSKSDIRTFKKYTKQYQNMKEFSFDAGKINVLFSIL